MLPRILERERERVELSKILYVTKYIDFYESRGFLTSSCVLYMCKQFIQFVSNFRFLQPHLQVFYRIADLGSLSRKVADLLFSFTLLPYFIFSLNLDVVG